MSEHVYRVTEIVGSSSEGLDAAIRNGIGRASRTLRHLDWFEVTEVRGHIVDGAIEHYHYFAENLVPTDEAGEQDHLTRLRSFAAACESAAGPLLPHLTTVNTARDMDLMRHVLGDDKLHYFGISYGTQLGGVYAHLFPQRVGRAALDAVVDPTADARQGAKRLALAQLALTGVITVVIS